MAFYKKETVDQRRKKELQKVTLGDGQSLDQYLKPIKIGGESSPLELSSSVEGKWYPSYADIVFNKTPAKVRINGDLEVAGDISASGDTTGILKSFTTGVFLDDPHVQTSGDATLVFTEGNGIDLTYTPALTSLTIAAIYGTDSTRGIIRLATEAEVTAGTVDDRAVTPDTLEDGYNGSANVVTTGALNSGSITSGFGTIDNGASNITTTGRITGGQVNASSPTLTSATDDDYSIKSEQTLNDTSAAGGTQEYAQINTDLTTTDTTGWDSVYLINQQVGGTSKFRVTSTGAATFASTVTSSNGISGLWCASGNSNVSYRGNTVDYWYVGNQSMGDAITTGDFGTYKFSSAMFTAQHSAQLQGWNLTTTFSSGHDFEVEMWDIEVSAGGSYADSATKIGDTQSVTALSLKIYSIGQVGLDYTLAAGHLLFMPIRYTDGSGTFYTYGTVGMEFTNA